MLDKLGDHIWALQVALRLSDWDVRLKVEEGPEDPEALAQVIPTYGRKVAGLKLAPDLLEDYEAKEISNTLVHELLHIVLAPVTDVIRADLNAFGGLTQREYDGLWHYYARECEFAVDHLAMVLGPLVPPWPWAGGTKNATLKTVDLNEHHIKTPDDAPPDRNRG